MQTITLNNKDYVIIEKTAYDEMCAGSDSERFPSEFVDKLFDSDNKIGVWREYRGMTMTELAARIGVSQSYISDIERGKKDGSIKVIKAIATALDADIELVI
ncbi:helix-turn-helix domain-containing protein [Rappaport israeli]|uniref:helix-turn-helix domain-containing protein n=1 Tax=Rappaport israeli TaxID=1839807 RepID=UPI000931335B|nr:helix-turn-helix transcriptional regulator [Rappaport israeli]